MIEIKTREDVIDLFKQAAMTDRLLPSVHRAGAKCALGDYIVSQITSDDADVRRINRNLTQADIDAWEFVTLTLYPILGDRRTKRIVWQRSSGFGWKRIAALNLVCRNTAKKVFDEGINRVFDHFIETG